MQIESTFGPATVQICDDEGVLCVQINGTWCQADDVGCSWQIAKWRDALRLARDRARLDAVYDQWCAIKEAA